MIRKLESLAEREAAREAVEHSRQQQLIQQQRREEQFKARKLAAQEKIVDQNWLAKQKKMITDAESASELVRAFECDES